MLSVQMMTYGYKLVMEKLTEEEVARCVYAWLSVASLLHAENIVAADFRWPNMMKQQPRRQLAGTPPNPAYKELAWIPLIIDLEQARKASQKPLQVRHWQASRCSMGDVLGLGAHCMQAFAALAE
jgi:hypothetical protein